MFVVNGMPANITTFTASLFASFGVVCFVPICHYLMQMSLKCRRTLSVACQKSEVSEHTEIVICFSLLLFHFCVECSKFRKQFS